MTQTQITNAQLNAATAGLVPPNGFIAKAMADRTGPPAPPIVPTGTPNSVSAGKLAKHVDTKEGTVAHQAKPSIILAGVDHGGKARASAFAESERDAAKAAADVSGLSTIDVSTAPLAELAAQLPMGKIYESGKAFVPFIKTNLFHELIEQAPAIAQKPRDTSLTRGMSSEHKNIITKAEPASDRSKPKVGSMFLAYDEVEEDAWYEAVVVKVVDNGSLILRWRDYDEEAPFNQKIEQLGLLPPQLPATK